MRVLYWLHWWIQWMRLSSLLIRCVWLVLKYVFLFSFLVLIIAVLIVKGRGQSVGIFPCKLIVPLSSFYKDFPSFLPFSFLLFSLHWCVTHENVNTNSHYLAERYLQYLDITLLPFPICIIYLHLCHKNMCTLLHRQIVMAFKS